jgi:hypothetical protein
MTPRFAYCETCALTFCEQSMRDVICPICVSNVGVVVVLGHLDTLLRQHFAWELAAATSEMPWTMLVSSDGKLHAMGRR